MKGARAREALLGDDINEMNKAVAWGAKESSEMNFPDFDRTPMDALNEIIWKSVKGADSEMPVSVHRFQSASLSADNGPVHVRFLNRRNRL